MVRIIILCILINLWSNSIAQERQIPVPFSQPIELTGNAGNDLDIYENIAYSVGNDIELEGGTPEYKYVWATPAGDTILNPMFVLINSTGTFYLTVSDANNCTLLDSISVSYATADANDPLYQVPHIYPNPANEFLNYRIVTLHEPAELSLISAAGHVVFKKSISVSSDFAEGILDIRTIPPGSYILSVRTALGEYSDKIVIKR
jgi:hypothetical protein